MGPFCSLIESAFHLTVIVHAHGEAREEYEGDLKGCRQFFQIPTKLLYLHINSIVALKRELWRI